MANFKATRFILVILGVFLTLNGASVSSSGELKYANCDVGHPLSKVTKCVINGDLKDGHVINGIMEFVPGNNFKIYLKLT